MNGKPAKVYGIRQPNGTGMMTTLIYLQAVRLANTAFRLAQEVLAESKAGEGA